MESALAVLGQRRRYEMKLVWKPSVPCGASTNACPAGHCPTPDQLVTVTQCSLQIEDAGKPTGTTLQ
ncbi:hypothetical protein [Allorhodopirellula heiligendammensis]|uniref:Uncharacterized protein n=1 Tax=Allorhodopirellula heiligendammensis TaxID=2714739 RepID=A0A5C6B276_9BACT|nr:hypothetical protein [Allorhodopirellula heiligendammensis]TWU05336.1 hypothetical protein Poly21_57570 [Allorhodopirellula heiligendammensis]